MLFQTHFSAMRAIYCVEAVNSAQRKQIDELFREIQTVAEVRKLSTGRIVSYAVQTKANCCEILDEIAEVLRSINEHSLCLQPVDNVAMDIVSDLCRASGSTLLSVPTCGICGEKELFPGATITICSRGKACIVRYYCPRCTALECKPKVSDFVRALLDADRRNIRLQAEVKPLKRKSRRDLSFTIAR
jgi:putative lipoic acid-binding regulatory protein